MKRSVIMMGGKTFVLSLPSIWVKKYGIKKGEELDIEEISSGLLVRTEKVIGNRNIALNVSNLNDSLIWRYIFAAYISGSDEIEVKFSLDKKNVVYKVAGKLIGCTIVDEGANFIRIKDVGGDIKEFDNIFRRVFYMAGSLFSEGIDSVMSKNYTCLAAANERDYDVNYAVNFCLRFLNKKGYFEEKKILLYYVTLREMEFFSDELSELFVAIGKNKLKVGKPFIEILSAINKMYDNYHKLFFKFSEEDALEMVSHKNAILVKIGSFSQKATNDELKVLGHLRSMTLILFNLMEPNLEQNI